jgi:hypothetical protein
VNLFVILEVGMEIEIKSIRREYAEAILKDGNTTLATGALNEEEIRELAIVFISSADDLLCYMRANTEKAEELIAELIEDLEAT